MMSCTTLMMTKTLRLCHHLIIQKFGDGLMTIGNNQHRLFILSTALHKQGFILGVFMPHNTFGAIPFFIKLLALLLGSIIALVLSGDINVDSDDNAKLNLNLKAAIKLVCSVSLGLFLGEFTIDYFNYEHLSYYSQAGILMTFSIFGMLIFGILYRSVQLTLSNKTLSEIVIEIKETAKALLK